MLAQGVLALSLVIRVYDSYGVPRDHLARARTTVEGIMKSAGVSVTWPTCPCLSPVSSDEVIIRIIAAPPTSRTSSLGFSFVDFGLRSGSLATAFADRVQALAAIAGIDEGELLGRVIAHEISHLLLGTREHGLRGLMRGEWMPTEVADQSRSEWLLTISEGRKIREAIRRRSLAPPMMIVDTDPAPVSTQ